MVKLKDIIQQHGSLFITIEGADGSGKSTQAVELHKKLEQYGKAILVQEPGTTQLGQKLRRMLLRLDEPLTACPTSELLLFMAARAQLMHEVIYPALQRGVHVVCDRGIGSTMAYQCAGSGLNPEMARSISEALERHTWQRELKSFTRRMIVVCDVPSEVAKRRMTGKKLDYWESQSDAFRFSVRQAFRTLGDYLPTHHVIQVDATRSVEEVTEKIWHEIRTGLDRLDQLAPSWLSQG
jgi:dTMP kinase